MNIRSVILGLSVLVLTLVAALVYVLTREPVASASAPSRPTAQTNVVTRVAVRKFNSTNYFLLPSGFSWASLESTNYANYILNLRAIGCPEETIRDIVVADVAKQFATRRAQLMEMGTTRPFWKTESSPDPARQQALRTLEDQQRSLIRQLLGADLDSEIEKYRLDMPGRSLDFTFLDADKRTRVQDIVEKYQRRESDLRDRAGGLWLESDEQALQGQSQLREIELKAVLNPSELQEFGLRFSALSDELRSTLKGFEPTEEEFRKLFSARSAYDEAMASVTSAGSDPSANGEKLSQLQADAQETLNQELKELLGSERWEKYEKQQDPSYQTLTRLSERFNLPAATTDRAFEFLRVAEEQSQRLISDTTLEPERLEEALREISLETSMAVSNALGAGAFRAFRSTGGNAWLSPGAQ